MQNVPLTHSSYLRPYEVGPIINRKTSTVWDMLRREVLPHVKLRGKYLIRREALMQWLAEQEKGGI